MCPSMHIRCQYSLQVQKVRFMHRYLVRRGMVGVQYMRDTQEDSTVRGLAGSIRKGEYSGQGTVSCVRRGSAWFVVFLGFGGHRDP